jgi:UDP-N-acetylmuramyl-tripeptide synthetase
MNNKLKEYIDVLKANNLVTDLKCGGYEELVIKQITYDSKAVKEGCLFACKGAAFKKEYLEDAINRGAVCYVSEVDYKIEGAAAIIVNDIRRAMPYIARMHYDIPKDFYCIGITGTKGKTTTAYYLKAIFDEYMSEIEKPEVGFMTTVETYDGKERISSGITTPESFEIYRHFRNAYDSGIRHMIMEFSSQALKYRRVQGIELETAVFLNISEDHISPIEHPDFNDYFESKLKIFSQCKKAVICADSMHFEKISEAAKKAGETVTFGIDNDADFKAYDVIALGDRTSFCVDIDGKKEEFILNMRGVFNIENALAAIAVSKHFNIPIKDIKNALLKVSVPGRVEEYHSKDEKVHAIVDYAHNGFSFRSIIGAARQCWPDSRIVTVFGCPGGKALNRRKDMGIAAGEMSDYIYLTADDPAKEKIEDICADIGTYINTTGCEYSIISDRVEAIKTAIMKSDIPTVVLVLGKGCEKTQKTANGVEPYVSDAAAVKEALKNYNKYAR